MLLYRNCYTKIEIIFTKDGLVWLGAPYHRLDSGQTFQVLGTLPFVSYETLFSDFWKYLCGNVSF